MYDHVVAEVKYIDTGDHVHRELQLEHVEAAFTPEGCQRDQMKSRRVVEGGLNEAVRLVVEERRLPCKVCCPDLDGVSLTASTGSQGVTGTWPEDA